jgi:hypothetical protein
VRRTSTDTAEENLSLTEEFNKIFDECAKELRKKKEEKEKANHEACLAQISTYSLYKVLPTTAQTEISGYIGHLPQEHLHALLEKLKNDNYNDFIYSLEKLDPDCRLLDKSFEWVLLKKEAIVELTNTSKSFVHHHPEATELSNEVPPKDIPADLVAINVYFGVKEWMNRKLCIFCISFVLSLSYDSFPSFTSTNEFYR